METTIVENVRVSPKIALLNRYVQKVKQVAISSIDPVYTDNELRAFNIEIEATPRHMSYFKRLIAADANLRIS